MVVAEQTASGSSSPASQADVAKMVRAAYEANEPLFSVGGGTALDFGSVAPGAGQSLPLTGLNKVVEYAPRDMTILVEAGVTMADLATTLAAEGQMLPIDVPRVQEATIGGVVATNWCGPRRYGQGTARDYVIGIHAVDGRGVEFKGGGRVVKNVAGYDFCKLLTGSLGTLGVITQLCLKVKPLPEQAATVVADCADLTIAESALRRMADLEAPPVGVDLLVGSAWAYESTPTIRLAVRAEGTEAEVDWLTKRVESECSSAGCATADRLSAVEAAALWARQIEFADRGAGESDDNSPMVLQIAVPPSAVANTIARITEVDSNCTIQAHAASGMIVVRFSKFSQSELSSVLVAKLRPAAVQLGGSVVVVRSKLEGITPHLTWGGRTDALVLLERIKRKFDPRNILNPGRYVFD